MQFLLRSFSLGKALLSTVAFAPDSFGWNPFPYHDSTRFQRIEATSCFAFSRLNTRQTEKRRYTFLYSLINCENLAR